MKEKYFIIRKLMFNILIKKITHTLCEFYFYIILDTLFSNKLLKYDTMYLGDYL